MAQANATFSKRASRVIEVTAHAYSEDNGYTRIQLVSTLDKSKQMIALPHAEAVELVRQMIEGLYEHYSACPGYITFLVESWNRGAAALGRRNVEL